MVPIEVGLGGVEYVEIELTVAYGFPRGSTEVGLPICRGKGFVESETCNISSSLYTDSDGNINGRES